MLKFIYMDRIGRALNMIDTMLKKMILAKLNNPAMNQDNFFISYRK